MKYEITETQTFEYEDPETGEKTFSANIAINDSFLLQLGTDGQYSIPFSKEACWNDDKTQDAAAENLDADELAEMLGLEKTPSLEEIESI